MFCYFKYYLRLPYLYYYVIALNIYSYFSKGFLCNCAMSQITFCYLCLCFYFFFDTIFAEILLLSSGDIETNPGSGNPSVIKFCHWHLNDMATHDFMKVPLIETFIRT